MSRRGCTLQKGGARRVAWARALGGALLAWTCLQPARCLAFDTDALLRIVVGEHVNAIERVLERLPAPLRSHYALVFASRSLQQASDRDPRVVLFSDDGRFVLTFNGHPSQRGYNALETMQFDDERKQFVFRELTFPDPSMPDVPVAVSEPNPQKCLACHGHPARPVWDTHPVWPGAYGQRYRAQLGVAEQDGLNRFLAASSGHPRYRTLKNLPVCEDYNTFHPNTKTRYDGSAAESPNATLARLFTRLNAQAIVRELSLAPRFRDFQYALLGALTPDCGALQDLLPERAGDLAQPYTEFAAAIQQAQRAQDDLKHMRLRALTPGAMVWAAPPPETLTRFRYVVESGLRIPTSDWTLALEKGSFDVNAPESMQSMLDRLMLAAVVRDDATVQDLALLRDLGASHRYCAYLRKATAERLPEAWAGLARPLPISAGRQTSTDVAATQSESVPASLSRCAGCHRGDIGPALPFEHPPELAERLRVGRYPRGSLIQEIVYRLSPSAGIEHMPMGQDLQDDERDALQAYFHGLAGPGVP